MPDLKTIEALKKRIDRLGNEADLLSEEGDEIRVIKPSQHNLNGELDSLLSDDLYSNSSKFDIEDESAIEKVIGTGSGLEDIDSFLDTNNSFLSDIDEGKFDKTREESTPDSISQEKNLEDTNKDKDLFSDDFETPDFDFDDLQIDETLEETQEPKLNENLTNSSEDDELLNNLNDFIDAENFSNTDSKTEEKIETSEEDSEASELNDDLLNDLLVEAQKTTENERFESDGKNAENFFQLDEFEESSEALEESEFPEEKEEEKDSLFGDGESSFDSYIDTDISEFELDNNVASSKKTTTKQKFETPFIATGEAEIKKEFSISDNKLFKIKKNLTYLPKNLKIIIEEYIADETTTEEDVSIITEMLYNNDSAKKIADHMEQAIGKPIKLPSRYKSLSGYDLEARQNSFMYKFITQYLPTLLITVSVLAGITFFLWVFIWLLAPWVASSAKYKEGRQYIEEAAYEQAEDSFNIAYFGSENQRWPYKGRPNKDEVFKYAKMYEQRRLYNYAENKYKLLLKRHWHQSKTRKKAKLHYARMLSEDLNRYEEAIIQLMEIKAGGKVPDSKIEFDRLGNDAEADFALARVNMLWGDDAQDPSKYEEALDNLKAYAKVKKKSLAFKLKIYELWYLSKVGKTKLLAKALNEDILNSKKIKKFRKSQKDLRIYNDFLDHFLSRSHIKEPLPRLLSELETSFPKDPEITWHRSRQQRVAVFHQQERKTLMKMETLLRTTQFHSKRELRIKVLGKSRIGEIDYAENKIQSAKNFFTDAIVDYEELLERKILKPHAEFGKIYANLGDIYYYQAGNFDAAYIEYAKGEKNLYDSYVVDYKQGFIDYWRGNYKKAKEQFYYVLEAVPDNNNAIYAMANTMLLDYNLSHAQSHFVRYIHNLNDLIPGFENNLNPQRKEQAAVLLGLEAAYNNLGITYFRQYERSSDYKKREKSMQMLTRSIEYYNVLSRKDTIRAGASIEGIRKYSIPNTNSIASLNQKEILYNETTPRLINIEEIPYDLKDPSMAKVLDKESIFSKEETEEMLELLDSEAQNNE